MKMARLRPGMFLNVSLANDERESLVIPGTGADAGGGTPVRIRGERRQGRTPRSAHRRPAAGQCRSGRRARVAGEQVIVEGTQKVRDGVPVRTTEIGAGLDSPVPERRARTKPSTAAPVAVRQ